MTASKRFATHHTRVIIASDENWPCTQVTVICDRCNAAAQTEGSLDRDPLLDALTQLDEHPCALVSLDEHGYPVPLPEPQSR